MRIWRSDISAWSLLASGWMGRRVKGKKKRNEEWEGGDRGRRQNRSRKSKTYLSNEGETRREREQISWLSWRKCLLCMKDRQKAKMKCQTSGPLPLSLFLKGKKSWSDGMFGVLSRLRCDQRRLLTAVFAYWDSGGSEAAQNMSVKKPHTLLFLNLCWYTMQYQSNAFRVYTLLYIIFLRLCEEQPASRTKRWWSFVSCPEDKYLSTRCCFPDQGPWPSQ